MSKICYKLDSCLNFLNNVTKYKNKKFMDGETA